MFVVCHATARGFKERRVQYSLAPSPSRTNKREIEFYQFATHVFSPLNALHFSCGGVRRSRAIPLLDILRGGAAPTPPTATSAGYVAAGRTAAQSRMHH